MATKNINLLLIEYGLLQQEIFTRHLQQLNLVEKNIHYNSFCCKCLQEADQILKSNCIDIVVLNNDLPEAGDNMAIDFLHKFHGTQLPIIVLTGIESSDEGKRAIQAGAQDYLTKGDVTPKQIHLTIMHTLERAEKQNELEEIRLQQAQLLKMATLGEMAGNIAHEINGPLTVLMSYAMELKKKSDKLTPEAIARETEGIMNVIHRVDKTIQSLRNFARSGGEHIFHEYKISDIIEETLLICKARLKKESIELLLNIDEDCTLFCNDVQISQVLLNLIHNASDAIKNMETKWIEISTYQDEHCFSLQVQDSGMAPPEDVSRQIFNQYFTTKEKGSGTGLGLSISKKIIEGHYGTISIVKNPHTTFLIKIPKQMKKAC